MSPLNKWSHLPPTELAMVTMCENELTRIRERYSAMPDPRRTGERTVLMQRYREECEPWQTVILTITSRYHPPLIVDTNSELGKQILSVLGAPE